MVFITSYNCAGALESLGIDYILIGHALEELFGRTKLFKKIVKLLIFPQWRDEHNSKRR